MRAELVDLLLSSLHASWPGRPALGRRSGRLCTGEQKSKRRGRRRRRGCRRRCRLPRRVKKKAKACPKRRGMRFLLEDFFLNLLPYISFGTDSQGRPSRGRQVWARRHRGRLVPGQPGLPLPARPPRHLTTSSFRHKHITEPHIPAYNRHITEQKQPRGGCRTHFARLLRYLSRLC